MRSFTTFSTQLKSRTPGICVALIMSLRSMCSLEPGQARYPAERRYVRCAFRSSSTGIRPTRRAAQSAEKLQGGHPAPAVRNPHPGSHWREDHRARNRARRAQGRACKVLRRRYHPQEKAARKAEGRQKAHAPDRDRLTAERGFHERAAH